MNAASRFRAAGTLLLSGQEGERYATSLDDGAVYRLNEPAYLVLEGAKSGSSLGDIVNSLCRTFPEVPAEEIHRDVEEVLREFVAQGILAREPEEPAR